jgi:hypothetical protein
MSKIPWLKYRKREELHQQIQPPDEKILKYSELFSEEEWTRLDSD